MSAAILRASLTDRPNMPCALVYVHCTHTAVYLLHAAGYTYRRTTRQRHVDRQEEREKERREVDRSESDLPSFCLSQVSPKISGSLRARARGVVGTPSFT